MPTNISGIREVSPKLLVWDVETSSIDIMHRTYDLRVNRSRYDVDQIVRDWVMFGAAWKWVDDEQTHCISVSSKDPQNDYEVIRVLHGVLEKADVLIGHNSDAFDLKKFNTRAVFHGFDPIAKKQSVDTLKIARRQFKFTSNKLRYIANYLGISAKDESPNWDKCLEGDPDELRYMRDYNRQDVVVTEELYKKLRAWDHSHPNLNVMHDTVDAKGEHVDLCPRCLSPDIVKAGRSYKKVGYSQRRKCKSCGTSFVLGKTYSVGEYR